MPRGVVQEVEAVEEKPVAGVIMGMTGLSYLFVLTALAAGIAWIVFVAKARTHNVLGDDAYDLTGPTGDQPIGESNLNTSTVCFQAVVVSVLFYFVARHHFSNLHY